ncbi:MAG: hypothetical protein K6C10_05065 [Prevotella sp.]|nr:hypothetical protein [Prevotella sp.]
MIQTQLLKLDPPYQIISANGYVGIQVATLIVAEEKEAAHLRLSTFSRSYTEYHSYPVVNYGLKRGLEEQMKYNRMPWDDFEQYQIRRRMQPEGAVWDGVEVKDVRILGLAGANNDAIDLGYFIYLIPAVRGFDPLLHVWDKKSTSRIYDFYTGLGNVGLNTQTVMASSFRGNDGVIIDERNEFIIMLSLEQSTDNDVSFIKVSVREPEVDYSLDEKGINFRCVIDPTNEDSVNDCSATIAEGLHGITPFLPTKNLKLISKKDLIDGEGPHTAFMNHLITIINEYYKNY